MMQIGEVLARVEELVAWLFMRRDRQALVRGFDTVIATAFKFVVPRVVPKPIF